MIKADGSGRKYKQVPHLLFLLLFLFYCLNLCSAKCMFIPLIVTARKIKRLPASSSSPSRLQTVTYTVYHIIRGSERQQDVVPKLQPKFAGSDENFGKSGGIMNVLDVLYI